MASWDQDTIDSGVSAFDLMERAGRALSSKILERIRPFGASGHMVVLVGPGNNGGDGLVISRRLFEAGLSVTVIVRSRRKLSALGTEMLNRLPSGVQVLQLEGSRALDARAVLHTADCIIDALLGSGQTAAPREPIADVVAAVCEARSRRPIFIIAVDVPTGINADTGQVYAQAITADATVTVQLIKRGMVQFPARGYCGEIHSVDASIHGSAGPTFALCDSVVVASGPVPHDSFKGSFGSVAVIAGSDRYPGACILAAEACHQAGAGLVTTFAHEGLSPAIIRFGESASEFYEALKDDVFCQELGERYDTFLIGPGIGRSEKAATGARNLIRHLNSAEKQLVVDADGLHALLGDPGMLKTLKPTTILTPHPGEAAALLSCSSFEVQQDRFSAVTRLAARTDATFVLKGAYSIVWSAGGGTVYPLADPILAVGGTGDVFAGWVSASLAVGYPAKQAILRALSLQEESCRVFRLRGRDHISPTELIPIPAL